MDDLKSIAMQSFKFLVDNHGFVWATNCRDDEFIVLVSRPCLTVCNYVFIKQIPIDGVTVYIWIAPPDGPSDAFDRLGVGYKIDFGDEYDEPLEFIQFMAKRIVNILPYLDGLVEATRLELISPPRKSLRYISYQLSRSAYESVASYASSQNGQYCMDLFATANDLISMNISWDQFYLEVENIAKQLLQDPLLPQILHHPHFGSEPSMLGSCLADILYIETLLPYKPK